MWQLELPLGLLPGTWPLVPQNILLGSQALSLQADNGGAVWCLPWAMAGSCSKGAGGPASRGPGSCSGPGILL